MVEQCRGDSRLSLSTRSGDGLAEGDRGYVVGARKRKKCALVGCLVSGWSILSLVGELCTGRSIRTPNLTR